MAGGGRASGRAGGSSSRVGGFSITIQGKEKIYFQAAGGEFRELRDTNNVVSKETASKLLKNKKAKPISKAEMNKIKEARKKDRAATPDYELGYGTGPGGSIDLAARKAARTSRLAGRVSKRRR